MTRPSSHPIYTDQWRSAVRAGAASSAEVLADLIVDEFRPSTSIDVGAGEGWLMRALEQRGVQAAGVDGSWVDDPSIGHVDLTAPPYPDLTEIIATYYDGWGIARSTVDVVTCLEVAEHVPQQHAGALVEWLCSMAEVVVFSAAIPGQGGEGHVNEQWPEYWRLLFGLHDYIGSGALRARLWGDERVSWWYRQNLLVFAPAAKLVGLDPDGVRLPADGCPPLVHPGLWIHRGLDRPARRGSRR